ncbi:putative disease resistance protein At3g14460 [Pistacia vera]|uniref:putative disease resistance protein At3g14460 n=1 Tax=Pistacia vera TaxID=55513 RepID=UPI001262B701|nr:putative disease resistance protein At3g14460 [Pistacia vera]
MGESFVQGVPKLEELRIRGCKDITFKGMESHQDISSLHGLAPERCSQVLSTVAEEEEKQLQQRLPCRLHNLELRDCENLAKLPQTLHNLSSLTDISIKNCSNLVSFAEVVGLPSQLRSITIENCKARGVEALVHSSMTSLESFKISDCESVKYIARVQLPPNVKRLDIKYCNNLQTLVDNEVSEMLEESINSGSSQNTSLLEYLNIRDCESLACLLSHGELPCSVKRIEIDNCPNLFSFSPRGNLPTALGSLSIRQCSKLESIAETVNDNTSLQRFRIDGCKNLKLLPDCLNKLSHLQEFKVMDCPSFIQFPDGGLPSTKLSTLYINECEKLVALPNGMCNLTSLRNLTIQKCPGIVSFPEDGFPTNIWSLEIKDANICKPLFEWGLHRLTSLSELKISGGCDDVESFPQEEIGMKLPTSLDTLEIENFPNLESLSSSVQNLTSLTELHFVRCPKLKYFPNGLPPSIDYLYIGGCPLLEEKCKKNAGYWPIIANIIPESP